MGWLITLGILVLLAILPLGAAVNYHSEGFFLDVIAGPVRIPILPKKKKDPNKKEKKSSVCRRNRRVNKKALQCCNAFLFNFILIREKREFLLL